MKSMGYTIQLPYEIALCPGSPHFTIMPDKFTSQEKITATNGKTNEINGHHLKKIKSASKCSTAKAVYGHVLKIFT